MRTDGQRLLFGLAAVAAFTMFFIGLKLIPIDYAAVLEKEWSSTRPVDR
jgi:hypothetical protein